MSYYEKNKDKIKERVKEYQKNNPEKVREYGKKYCNTHKERIKIRKKKWEAENKDKRKGYDNKYREANKEKIKEKSTEKVNCECGLVISRNHLSAHRKTTHHIDMISETKPIVCSNTTCKYCSLTKERLAREEFQKMYGEYM